MNPPLWAQFTGYGRVLCAQKQRHGKPPQHSLQQVEGHASSKGEYWGVWWVVKTRNPGPGEGAPQRLNSVV